MRLSLRAAFCLLPFVAIVALPPAAHGQTIEEILINTPNDPGDPGTPVPDSPNEYIELSFPAAELLDNALVLVIEGDDGGSSGADDPGTVLNVIDLDEVSVGDNGRLLVVDSTGMQPYGEGDPDSFTVLEGLGREGNVADASRGFLANGTSTFVLAVYDDDTPLPAVNDDLDGDNDGTPEGLDAALGAGLEVLDAVALQDQSNEQGASDITYTLDQGPVVGPQPFDPEAEGARPFRPDWIARKPDGSWCGANLVFGTGPPAYETSGTLVTDEDCASKAISPGTANDALPVELAAFQVQGDEGAAVLSWSTLSETNNLGFEVQQRVNGTFREVGFVPGAGTTVEQQEYAYRVEDLSPGTYTFRLRQVDADGTATLSAERAVTIGLAERFALSPAAPNPFRTSTTLSLRVQAPEQVRVDLYNMLGQPVRRLFAGRVTPARPATITIDAAGLANGQYICRIQGESFAEARSVTVVK